MIKDENEITEEDFLDTIRRWKHYWMNQRQNSEADFKNYFERAFGVDANMQHDLAKRLNDQLQPFRVLMQINVDAARNAQEYIKRVAVRNESLTDANEKLREVNMELRREIEDLKKSITIQDHK